VTQFRLTDEQVQAIGPEKVSNGKQCISYEMWKDPAFRESVSSKCPTDPFVVKRLALPAPEGAFAPRSRRTQRGPLRRSGVIGAAV
jgi:hypothetical protein